MNQEEYSRALIEEMKPANRRLARSEARVKYLLTEGFISQERADYAARVLSVDEGLAEARAALKLENELDAVDCCEHIKARIASIYYLSPPQNQQQWGMINQKRYVRFIQTDVKAYLERKQGQEGPN